jgi:hypothetical protein
LRNNYALGKLLEKVHISHYKEWMKHTQLVPGADLETFAEFLMRKVKEVPPSMMTLVEAQRSKQSLRIDQWEDSRSWLLKCVITSSSERSDGREYVVSSRHHPATLLNL